MVAGAAICMPIPLLLHMADPHRKPSTFLRRVWNVITVSREFIAYLRRTLAEMTAEAYTARCEIESIRASLDQAGAGYRYADAVYRRAGVL